jgi:hypothetical protein
VDAGGSVKIPSGLQCQYDNSTASLTFTNPTGRFFGDGSGSKISFSTLGRDAIDVNAGLGFRIDGLNLSMAPPLTTRGGYLVNISNGQNITASDLWLSNSDLSGMRWANVTTGHITRVHVSNTLANGFFTINNRHLMVVNPSCNNTGDYCFETSYYDSQGTPCTDITVTGLSSENDTSAMAPTLAACSITDAKTCHSQTLSERMKLPGVNRIDQWRPGVSVHDHGFEHNFDVFVPPVGGGAAIEFA